MIEDDMANDSSMWRILQAQTLTLKECYQILSNSKRTIPDDLEINKLLAYETKKFKPNKSE